MIMRHSITALVPTKTGKIYSVAHLEQMKSKMSGDIPLYGELSNDSHTGLGGEFSFDCMADVVSLSNVSHEISNPHIQDNILSFDIQVLNTPNGKVLQKILDQCTFGARGIGSIDENGIVQDDYTFITFDAILK